MNSTSRNCGAMTSEHELVDYQVRPQLPRPRPTLRPPGPPGRRPRWPRWTHRPPCASWTNSVRLHIEVDGATETLEPGRPGRSPALPGKASAWPSRTASSSPSPPTSTTISPAKAWPANSSTPPRASAAPLAWKYPTGFTSGSTARQHCTKPWAAHESEIAAEGPGRGGQRRLATGECRRGCPDPERCSRNGAPGPNLSSDRTVAAE